MLARASDVAVRPVKEQGDGLTWASEAVAGPFEGHVDGYIRTFRLALEQLPHGVLVFSRLGGILAANRAAETIFAYDAGELVGQPVERLLPELSHEMQADPWKRFWTNPDARRLGTEQPLSGVRSDGAVVPLEVGLKRFVEGGVHYVVASVVDVAERLRSARLLEATTGPLDLQRLIADLASRLAVSEAGAIDDAVVDSLRQISEVLQLDRATLWQTAAGDVNGVASHDWTRNPTAQSTVAAALTSLPRLEAAGRRGHLVHGEPTTCPAQLIAKR